MKLSEIIEAFARQNECIAGVCDAEPLDASLYEGEVVPFVSGDITRRTNPGVTLLGVRSVIVIGVAWETLLPCEHNINPYPTPTPLAVLSSLGSNRDYHRRVKGVLKELVATLRGFYDFRYKILVDGPGLDERALAVRAGLGFYGWHGLVVSPRFGTRFNVGCLLTDIPFEGSGEPAKTGECPPDCFRCVRACPTGALCCDENNRYDVTRCLSYLTQKKSLTPEEGALLGENNQLYGCDICQEACPFNTPRDKTYVDPTLWLSMGDADFTRVYGDTAMLWQGADLLRRNAAMVGEGFGKND